MARQTMPVKRQEKTRVRQYMQNESGLYQMPSGHTDTTYSDPQLIHETATSRIYRLSRGERYFLLKTPSRPTQALKSLIRREYEMSTSLSHPHIAHVFAYEYDTPVGEGIVMEYLDARTLSDFLGERQDMPTRRRIWKQLLEAVSYVHRKGLLHNDLKPENILVTRTDNDVKLIDFGLSDDDAHYVSKTLGCTPRYASPELLRRDTLDARSDVYSLGLIMKDIFGRRHSFISTKASRKDPHSRYRNVDALSRAYSRRNLPLFVIAAIIVTAAIAVPSIETARLNAHNDALTTRLHSIEEARQSRNDFRDSVFRDIEDRMSHLYDELETKLQAIPTQQQAYLEMGRSMQQLPEIQQYIESVTSDPELISIFISHYTLLQNRYYNKIVAIIQEKTVM